MKLLIASDIHGSAYYCKQLFNDIERESPDRIILLGDLLYHGPRNDLPKEYDPKAVIDLLNSKADCIFAVRGNCEAEVDQMVLSFPVLSDSMLLADGNRLIFATHGHIYNTTTPPKLHQGDILLHGHTHVQSLGLTDQGYYYFNPGSVSIPKEGNKHSYMIAQDETWTIKELSTGLVINSIILR